MGKDLLISEGIEQILAKAEEKKRVSLNKNLYHFINKEKHEFMAEYDSVCFDYSYLDAKQNALKVYMNTFMVLLGIVNPLSSCMNWLGVLHRLDREISNLLLISLRERDSE